MLSNSLIKLDLQIRHEHCKVSGIENLGMAMKFKGEVIGWVVHDAEHTDVLVRDLNGRVHTQRAQITAESGEFAIQTGAFCMGGGLDDPRVTEALAAC